MLSSSSQYLEALRQENYLCFLEWLIFIAQKYNNGANELNAEQAVDFLVFEWLNHGYCEEDAQKVAFLCALCDMNPQLLQEKLAYALSVSSIAISLCMVLQTNNLQAHYLSKTVMTGSEILTLMKKNEALMEWTTFEESLSAAKQQFSLWLKATDTRALATIGAKISAITQPRSILAKYIAVLETRKIEDDSLQATRLSLIRRLAFYLEEQTEMTPLVAEEITFYANRVREMQPARWEREYLDRIAPQSVWSWMTDVGLGFFSMVLPDKPLAELISGVSQGPEIS